MPGLLKAGKLTKAVAICPEVECLHTLFSNMTTGMSRHVIKLDIRGLVQEPSN